MFGKFIIIILVFFMQTSLLGQELTGTDKEKLKGFGIDYEQLLNDRPSSSYGNELRKMLEKDHKQKNNKTVGIVLGGLGLLTTVGGVLIRTGGDGQNGLSRTIMGSGIAVLGVIEMGVSISLFSSSKKRKRERDKIIEKYNPDWKEE